jgi:DNA polymerase
MKTDFGTLKELHEYYALNNNCALKKVATQPVYEITPPRKGIVFIGEAPGKNEDLQGVPFVGAAGKLLDKLLTETSFEREDIYISNVVKYRPPNNRDPHDTEKRACREWLNAELMFIKPSVIIPLGRHALGRFIPNQMISKVHGQSFSHKSGIPIFAMYHPAVGLYNPNLKSTLLEDFEKLRIFLDNGSKIENVQQEKSEVPSKEKNEKDQIVEDILDL